MALNQYVNKVNCDGNILIDLTGDTVTASSLVQGYIAHDASGAQIVGIIENGDFLGYGSNTRPLVNIAKVGQAIVRDSLDNTTGKAFSDLAVLSE